MYGMGYIACARFISGCSYMVEPHLVIGSILGTAKTRLRPANSDITADFGAHGLRIFHDAINKRTQCGSCICFTKRETVTRLEIS